MRRSLEEPPGKLREEDLPGQPAELLRLDFREESVTVKLLQDAGDKQSPGSWPLHHLLAHRERQMDRTGVRRSFLLLG